MPSRRPVPSGRETGRRQTGRANPLRNAIPVPNLWDRRPYHALLPSAKPLFPAEAVHLETGRFDELAAIVFRGAPDAVVVAASDGRYVLANEAAAELFGVSASDLVGRTIAEFAPPEFHTEEI